MKQVLIYSLKVWLTSGLVANIIFMVAIAYKYHCYFRAIKEINWYLSGVGGIPCY
jgi:hypothetical protein